MGSESKSNYPVYQCGENRFHPKIPPTAGPCRCVLSLATTENVLKD